MRICEWPRIVLILSLLGPSAAGAQDFLFRFDMGAPDSPLRDGFTRVTVNDLYTPEKGWGWAERPAGDFDRPGSRFNEEWYRKFWGPQITGKEPYFGEPVDDLWRDGIADKRDMVFRAKVPNGVYNVFVTLG
ncbi:MAG: hypothetical protein ACYC9O_10690, partial [Candidatus Latescibacterota bacterium]